MKNSEYFSGIDFYNNGNPFEDYFDDIGKCRIISGDSSNVIIKIKHWLPEKLIKELMKYR